jgi:hypothetical protein
MNKKRVLYFGSEENDFNLVAKMLAKSADAVECVCDEKPGDLGDHKLFKHHFLNRQTPCVPYEGIIINLDLNRNDGMNGLRILKMCRHSLCERVSKLPMILIVDDETLDLTERQMEEVRHYQIGLLYKPRFDGSHIKRLLFH